MLNVDAIVSQYPACLQHFDRDNYAAAFENYRKSSEVFFSELKENEIGSAVSQVMAIADGLQRRKIGSSTRLFDFKTFLCVYLYPAAVTFNDVSCAFADAVVAEWNSRYPKFSFTSGTYEEIKAGFRTKPFGM